MKRARSYPVNAISRFIFGFFFVLSVLAFSAPKAVAQDDPFAEIPKQNAKSSAKSPVANAPGPDARKNPTDDRRK